MAVSKQAYTCAAPWVASQLADAFRDAFIDASLMTAWHDEWATGLGAGLVLHRVLRVVYDSSKKYGTVFHWFTFLANGLSYYSFAHQWDIPNHRPGGTSKYDYAGNGSFVAGTSHRLFGNNILSTTVTLTRYTSGIRPNFSMFLLKAGNEYFSFFFMPPGTRQQPFVNLDLNTCGGLMLPVITGSTSADSSSVRISRVVRFLHVMAMRNSIWGYGTSVGRDADIVEAAAVGASYEGYGSGLSSFTSSTGNTMADGTISPSIGLRNEVSSLSSPPARLSIALPAEKSASNPNRTDDNTPVFTDLPFSMYFLDRLPLDFGIAWHYVNSTMEVQDIFQVTAGIEEWEILAVTNSSNTNNPSPLVLARIV